MDYRLRSGITLLVALVQILTPVSAVLAQPGPAPAARPAVELAPPDLPAVQEGKTPPATATETPTDVPAASPTLSETPVATAIPDPGDTETPTPVPTPTEQPEPSPDGTPSPTPDGTTATPTESPTVTPTPSQTAAQATETPDGTATPSATPTGTASATATATASATPTASATATPTPIGTATPLPGEPPDLRFAVDATSQTLVQGEEVTVTIRVENVGAVDAIDVRLRNALAEGLTFVPIPGKETLPAEPPLLPTATPTPAPTATSTPIETETPTLEPTSDATVTPEASASPSETPTASATPDASMTPDATATETATVSTTPVPSPTSETSTEVGGTSGLALQLAETPLPPAEAPEPVVAHEEVVGGDLIARVGTLPAGESVTLTYTVRAEVPAANTEAQAITDVLQLSAAGLDRPLVEEVTLVAVDPDLKWEALTPAGSEAAHLASPRVDLNIPADAYGGSEDLALTVVRPGDESALPDRGRGMAAQFELALLADPGPGRAPLPEAALNELEAADAALGLIPGEGEGEITVDPERPDAALSDTLDATRPLVEEDAVFDEPFELTVSFDGLADLDGLWADRKPFVAVWDESPGVWVRQPLAEVDPAANTVTVEATHFSTWGTGIGGTFPENGASIPLYDEAKVETFTGRATFSYPLWVPEGRAGMTPDLALTYASGSIDGVLGDVQSPWVGMGWNIDSAEITRQILNECPEDEETGEPDCTGATADEIYGYADQYVLAFNGTSYVLVEDPQHPGRYRTENESFLYIQRHNKELGNVEDGLESPPNDTQEWWEIATSDGTRYRLGWNADSEQLAPMKGYGPFNTGNPALDTGQLGGWDEDSVGAPSVIDWGDDTYQMWYAGTKSGVTRIGAAGISGGTAGSRMAAYDPLILDAEDGDLTYPMVKAGYDGAWGCEFVWTPQDGNQDGQGYVELDFTLDQAGTTYFWGHVWSSEFFFKLDNEAEIEWASPERNHFEWDKVHGDGVYLDAGPHTMRIRTDKRESPLDAMIVTQDADYTPIDVYCNSAPVLDLGESGEWDDEDVTDPTVLIDGEGTYHMWYAGSDGDTWAIGHATSEDGLNWTKDESNPVLEPSASGWDDEDVTGPTVLIDGEGTYHMWYEGNNEEIGYAESENGTTWSKDENNPVFQPTGSGWENQRVEDPSVLLDDGTYYMWYSGKKSGGGSDIGLATSDDGVYWMRNANNPIVSTISTLPSATYDGATYRLWGNQSATIKYLYNEDDPGDPGDWVSPGNADSNDWTDLGYAGEADNRVAFRWRVDEVSDVYGNTITYTYTEETRTVDGETETYDRASYLDKIRYTGDEGEACDPASAEDGACYEVRFVTGDRDEDFDGSGDIPPEEDREDFDNWDEKYLDKVEVYALNDTSSELLRTYDLSIDEVDRQDTDGDFETWDSLKLDDIVVTGGSGQDAVTAPKVSFDYINFDNRAQVLGEPEWGYPRLTEIHNGTGGTAEFTYGEDGRSAEQFYAWRVLWQETDDGVTGDVMRTEYTYGPACYNDAERGWCNDDDEGDLVGHEWTQATLKDFDGGVLSRLKHFFHTDEDHQGREWKTETRDASGILFFKTETDFTTIDWTNNGGYPDGVRFIYADEVRQYERQGTSMGLVSYSTYEYDEDWGDLTAQGHYDRDDNLLNRSEYTYLRNADDPRDVYLTGFLSRELTCTGDDLETCGDPEGVTTLADTYYGYDDTANDLGEVGELTLQQVRTLEDATETLDTTYDYDTYGNLTETRGHGAYGTLGTIPSDSAALDRVTTTTYDTTYHAFPKTVTGPDPDYTGPLAAHTVTTTYDFELQDELPFGLVRKVEDPNEAVTETQYDALGRITETWQPGQETRANVVTVYPELDNGEIDAPYTIELQIWDDGGPGADQYREAWAFYDGLGRILRTVGPAEDTNYYIQVDTAFNAMQLVEKVTRPYQVYVQNPQNPPDPPADWSEPLWVIRDVTETAYDGFGRAVEVTAPDGATVQTQYDGRKTTVVDPNGHKAVSTVDDFDRLVEVEEYSGASSGTYTLYATTTYEYDERSLLVETTDDADNETTITYDGLGRKTGMVDPDMGEWEYEYDLWGQLAIQTDARGAQTQMTYDKLGRLTEREARDDDQDPWVTVAEYTYDDTTSGNKGLGRLTGATSVYVSGSPTVTDSLVYDILGNVVESTRTIDGEDYTVSSTYDSLGRVLTTTYPDPDGEGELTAETVTTEYNERGLAESLSGDDDYVTGIAYTPSGQVDSQTLGNGVRVNYTYDPDSDRLSRLFVDKVGQLALLDLRYSYDLAGNVTQIDDGARGEVRGYVYDHLDRLTFAAVHEGTQMIEERYYTYDTIGNLLSFRHRRPPADRGRGAFTGGAADVAGTSYQTRADFNPLGETGLSSETYEAAGVMPYVRGVDGTGTGSNGATRGALYSGALAEGTTYQGAAGFNALGGESEGTSYQTLGVTPYVRGMVGGFGGYESSYSGPTGETTLTYTYAENNAGPHAVTSLSDGQSFVYDANGNMIERWLDTTKEWSHTFDAENRLVEVVDRTTTPDTTTTYVYDGDGARVKRVVDDGTTETTTLYVAGMEIKLVDDVEEQRTVYYAMGGAFRIIGGADEGVYFRHGDHLGSTSVLSDEDGLKVDGRGRLRPLR